MATQGGNRGGGGGYRDRGGYRGGYRGSPNNTEMIAYTGNRNALVEDLAMNRPVILRKRMNVEGDVRPGLEGRQLLEDL